MAALCRVLEMQAKEGSLDEAPELTERIAAAFAEARDHLHAEVGEVADR
jgi:hypothetical protein